jgi:hypothetical protein
VKVVDVDERLVMRDVPADDFLIYIYSADQFGARVRTQRVTGCTFIEAVRWAQGAVESSERYSVGLVEESPDGLALRWLLGTDPNSSLRDKLSQSLMLWPDEQVHVRF